MSMNGYLEEDELILYAMQALSGPEASAIADNLARDPDMRERLAEIQLTLGVYATATVPPQEAPASSKDRLLRAIQRDAVRQDTNVVQMPAPGSHAQPVQRRPKAAVRVLPWLGWAIAAMLLIGVLWQHQRGIALRRDLESRNAELQQKSTVLASTAGERQNLQAALQQQSQQVQHQAQQIDASKAEASTYKDQTEALRAKAASEAAKAQQQGRAAQQAITRANDLATVAEASAAERDALRNALAAEQNQSAQLNAQTTTARQVLDALSDPAALRVTLTVPKQKKNPTGRGTYVPGTGTLLFTASNLAPLRPNKTYELWLMPSDGSSPIPAGTFAPDASGNATLISTQFRRSIAAKGFAVTIENAGGSLTPTLPILLAGL